jgi:hypothetical protein
MTQITVERRFHSWPTVAHGGYVAGHLAARLDGPCEVTLRQAVPFDTPLTVRQDDRGRIVLGTDGAVMMRAQPTDLDVQVPAPVSFSEAAATAWDHASIPRHPTPTCFCCGYDRNEGDGLRVWPGSLPGRRTVAAGWIPHAVFGGESGALELPYVWAALDCPSFWGIVQWLPAMPNVVTIRLEGQVLGPVHAAQQHVVLGWPIAHRGRRMIGGSAILGPNGDLLACSRVTWLEVRDIPRR